MKLSDKEKARLKSKYGEWAVITGASSGIGLELATQLASAGFNLVLIARHLEKLQEVENHLKTNTTIEIKIVNVDVSETEGIDQIFEATKGLKVGLLIA